jgi:uncharacterized protein
VKRLEGAIGSTPVGRGAGELSSVSVGETAPFVVMAKPVGPACNLACGYCYYLQTAEMYERHHEFRMSDATLERFVRQFIEASPGPEVHFVWHGGEPTLAGLPFFQRAVALQRRYLPTGWRCWNNLQTNGTLLDDAWCAFLAEEGFEVGLSVDGPAILHDAQRPDHQGRGSAERVAAGLRRLLAHGVEPDLLCTVTAATAAQPLAVYRALREMGSTFIQFIPIVRPVAGGLSAESVSAQAYGEFLCAVFDEWIRRDLGQIVVQFFAESYRAWAGRQPTLCSLAETCGSVLVVEHDGAVYACDHFVRDSHRLGTIETTHLGTLARAPEQLRFGQQKRDSLPAQCRSCPWLFACGGGCPKDRLAVTDRGEPGLNVLCEGLRTFYQHADPLLRRMVALGSRPSALKDELRAEEQRRWRGVGRNDPCPCGSGRKAKRCCWPNRP